MTYTTERVSADDLLRILALSDTATAIYTTEEIRVETANHKMLAAWQKDASVIGKRIDEVLPELADHPFFDILRNVWRTGVTYRATAMPADINTNGTPQRYYFDFEYRAIKNEDGTMLCILHTSTDVTDLVMRGETIRLNEAELQKLNTKLENTNKNLGQSNSELTAVNQSLQAAKDDISHMFAQLAASEEKFRNVVEQLPIGVNLLHSRRMVIQLANKKFLEIWGKNVSETDVIGKTLTAVNPEFIGQPFMKWLDNVYLTGINYTNYNEKATVIRNGVAELRYYNIVFHALKNSKGEVTGILQIASDNTQEVLTTRHVQELNEELAATNEELMASNEELRSVNEEMLTIQDNLMVSNKQLTESEERFRNMAEGMNVFIGISDENGHLVYFNKIWATVTGRSISDLLNMGWIDLLHPEDKEGFMKMVTDAVQKQSSFTGEFRIKNKEDRYIWLIIQGSPRLHRDGSFAGHIASSIDITEHKRDDQRKSDFIGMVSHELKTPLTSLNGYLEIVRLDLKTKGDAMQVNLLDKAARQVSKMTTMINGFLNVSRLESGKLQMDKRRFDMAKLVEESKEETMSMYNNHQFVFDPVVETYVYADRDKIGHVFNNFISNAVKYSPYNSTIHIACVTVDGRAHVSVKDEGFGIAPDDQQKLFQRYYRVENKAVQSISGFGIGLYLCSEIIQRNEGQIWVESELGKGSTFFFSLPVIQ